MERERLNEEANDDSLPCRELDDYVIYDIDKNNKMVELDELDYDGSNLVASGFVKPLMLDDDEDDDASDNESESGAGPSRSSSATTAPSGSSSSTSAVVPQSDPDVVRRKLRLTSIFRYETEYTETNET